MNKSTQEVAKRLFELVSTGKNVQAVEELYADDVVNVEATPMPGGSRETRGKAAVKGKNQWWVDNHEIHSCKAAGPWPHEDRFIVKYEIDVTAKEGLMKGQRMQMEECGLYTVKNGKIAKEEFFYGGCPQENK